MRNTEFRPKDNNSDLYTIYNRFGEVNINLQNKITLPFGLLGFPEQQSFCLTRHNITNLQKFLILQSTEIDKMAFLVLPLDITNALIAKDDILEACKLTAIPDTQLAIVLIASTRKEKGERFITANTRAPILIDAEKKVGVQFVLPNNRYKIRQVI